VVSVSAHANVSIRQHKVLSKGLTVAPIYSSSNRNEYQGYLLGVKATDA
jgi:hypothetical protein